jgi:YfiH family protein
MSPRAGSPGPGGTATGVAVRALAETPVVDLNVPRIELVEWAGRFGLVAGITTRERDFSLGLWSDEPIGSVMTRWRAFRAAFADRFSGVVLGHQIHGTTVQWHAADPGGWLLWDAVDGHATSRTGMLLSVTVADCIPVYLAAPGRGVVALLHAGWRGVAAGILDRAVDVLQARSSIVCEDLVMHCGVGACGQCYEVGSEVAAKLTGAAADGPTRVDLRRLLAARAGRLGIPEVTISPFCTVHDHDRFFSHRASGGGAGRMVAYLGRPRP